MKQNFLMFLVLGMVFLSSCESIPTLYQNSTENPNHETTTKTPIATIITPIATYIDPGQDEPIQTSGTPISTLTPTATKKPDIPTLPPTLTETTELKLKLTATQVPLDAQIGSPIGIPNFAHPELSCQWMGLAGQVFGRDNLPIKDFVIEVGGNLEGEPVFGLGVAGQVEAYGPGGYEIKLRDEPISSDNTLWARVFDMDGNPISPLIHFPTYADCEKNLILLNFVYQVDQLSLTLFLPLIFNNSSNR